jgi:hypothetical protein
MAWGPIGEKSTLPTMAKSKNLSLLLAVSPDGVEGFIIYEGALTGKLFNYFIINLLKKI